MNRLRRRCLHACADRLSQAEIQPPVIDPDAQWAAMLGEVANRDGHRAESPDAAPTPSAHRGPNVSATHPTKGAPMGVAPTAMARNSAMTRPRISGSVESWMVLFAVVVKVCADSPMMTSAPPNSP